MENSYYDEQERLEQERRKRELQAELMRNNEIIDRKTDELTAILDRKIEKNTLIAKTFTDVSDRVEALTNKLYGCLQTYRKIEQYFPEIKAANDKYEKAIHDLRNAIKELRETVAKFQNETDKLIAERKAKLAGQLEKVTEVPAYHRQHEQQEQQEKHKNKRTSEIER